jgi:hypothetical protein
MGGVVLVKFALEIVTGAPLMRLTDLASLNSRADVGGGGKIGTVDIVTADKFGKPISRYNVI